MAELESTIAAHLAEWERAHVELAIYETDDPEIIARTIDRFCHEHLGAGVQGAMFYRSSIGAVAGLCLDDDGHVVLKAHQPSVSRNTLEEVVRLRAEVARSGGPSPRVLMGPTPIGAGLATVEVYANGGVIRDGHDPEVRRALAAGLHEMIVTLRPFVSESSLSLRKPPAELWPKPHSRLFDFEATQVGAEDIDRVARTAREQMIPAGEVVLAHGDWKAEHVLFDGSRIVAAFDWDSLCRDYEASVLGVTAHASCANWDLSDPTQAPTLDEARAFVADYERARGRPLSSQERQLCGALFAYSVAYTARCRHALGRDERREGGTFQHLIATHGVELLAL